MTRDYYFDSRHAAAYDSEHAGIEGDVAFYRDLALQSQAAGLPVLELGCGTGRVTIPIAAAGVTVVGLDRSPAMLAVARQKSAGFANPHWVEADMADFELAERFGLVCIPFRSFLHLTTAAAQQSCLAAARRHLFAGGRLALNVPNPEVAGLALSRSSLEPSFVSRVYQNMRLRYVTRIEMEQLLEVTGFQVEALYGGFAGETFTNESPEMIWVARA